MKTKSLFTILILSAVLVALGASCNKAATPRTDAQVANDVQGKVQSDPTLQGQQIGVQATNGVVTLSGNVNTDVQRQAASNDAGTVDGVRQVLNNLTVQQAAVAPEPQTQEQAPVSEPAREKPKASTSRRAAPATSTRGTTNYEDNHASMSQSEAPATSNTAVKTPPPPPVAPPPPQKVTIPDGTTLSIRLVDAVDSEVAKQGDTFRATLNAPITVDDSVVVPENADIEGRVIDVKSAGRFAGASLLQLELTKLSFNGRSYQIHTNQWSREGNSRGKNTAAKVGTGAALGAIIGGIAGGGKGAAIGGTVGAGAGGGVQAATKGQQIKLASEAVLNFQLQNPLTVTPSTKSERKPMNN